jgi:hypothetical protein
MTVALQRATRLILTSPTVNECSTSEERSEVARKAEVRWEREKKKKGS